MKANIQKWQTGKFSASERRILISKWVANATEATYNNAHIPRIFQKCGISLPVDGSQDDQINIRDLENYSVDDGNLLPNEAEADADAEDLLEADVTEEEVEDVSNDFDVDVNNYSSS